jgi:hypothetical protein
LCSVLPSFSRLQRELLTRRAVDDRGLEIEVVELQIELALP